jgi:flagellar hook protein FlgE
MWTSVSGLLAHGQRMSTIGNNISNINTTGFKGSRMDFQDILFSSVGTTYGNGQIGGGTGIGIVMNNFAQGSFETTTNVTDIAISGNGFFKVSPLNSNPSYYTRAGTFSLTKEGYVVDSNGYALQGWSLTNVNGKGSPTDIQFDTGTCSPRHTTEIDIQLNLPITGVTDNSTDATGQDPFFALLNTWDATQTPPLGTGAYAYQTTINVYDEGGTLHKLTVYFDKAERDVTNGGSGETCWEYIITMDPSEDVRDFSSAVGDITTTADVPDKLKGLLGAGTLTFNSSGQLTDMTCFVPQTDGTSGGSWWIGAAGSETVDLNAWVATPTTSDGLPLICPNFSGTAGLSNAYLPGTYDKPNQYADGRLIAIDLGFSSATGEWTFAGTAGTGAGGLVSAADIGTDKQHILGFGSAGERSNTAVTCQGNSYQEYTLAQNGYTFGYLSNISVSQNGVISGIYSNGKTLELYQVALYNFPSLQNLRHEGNNLFSETAASGMAVCGEPGSGQFGITESYRLEQSNVDLSTEFVNMITTQRGFQANSKNITTVDSMLETVINMKR